MSKNDANTQERTFLRWVNNHLSKSNVKVETIHDLTRDGVPLVKLMLNLASAEIASDPEDAKTISKFESKIQKLSKQANMQPTNRPNFLQNCNLCLEFLKDETKLIGIGSMDLVDGTNRNLLLGFLWMLILRFQIEKGKKGATSAETDLLQFLKSEIGSDINFSKAWKGGKTLENLCWKCSEVHEQKVEIQDKLVVIAKDETTKNTEMIHLANDYFGVPELIDADDLAADEPDKLSLITYVSYFRDYLVKERGEIEQKEAEAKKQEESNSKEQDRMEKERLERERQEKLRLEQERERLERERLEKEKLEAERLERERVEREEAERLEQERAEKERLEREERERLEQDAAMQELLQLKQKLEQQRLEQERLEKESLERERLEKERLEKEEQERLLKEALEKERLERERQEQERLEKALEEERQRREREMLEKERLEREKQERERLERERQEKERLEKERIERERMERERLEKERIEKERLERERLEKERLEKERLEKERLEKEQQEKQNVQGQDVLVLPSQPPITEPIKTDDIDRPWSIVDKVYYTTNEGFLAEDIAADVQCSPQEISTLFRDASKLVRPSL